MSDFVSSFWSIWITVIVIAGIIGLALLLISQKTMRIQPGEQVETMGHVWDGDLEEYNNPMPRWWIGLFWGTLAFGIAYLVMYPGLGTFAGVYKWTSKGQYESERSTAEDKYKAIYEKFQKMDIKAVAADPEAKQMGQRLFRT